MRAIELTFFFLISNCVFGQDELSVTERSNLIKLGSVCTCSEIPNEDATHLVLNIQCSELDRIENVPDLDKIQWPNNANGLKISAAFEGLGLSTLGKLPPNSQVESLRFSNNAIKTYWPDPFSDVPNLKKLSFSQNELTQITPDLFTDINQLEDLDLSYNKLSEFNPLDFKSLHLVKKFNLQSNQLKKIPLEALEPMSSLEDLDLSKNGIYNLLLQRSERALKCIRRLNLSGNMIRSIMKDSFPVNNSIELLDLSNNLIEMIEEDAFLPCTSLRELNLGHNNISLIFALPPSLQIVILRVNTLFHWLKFPSGIKYIDISYNRLSDLYDENSVNFSNLEVLNFGGNQIKEINIEKKLPKLYSLDISYNLIQQIPKSLSSLNFPNLEELRLDGNPVETVYFKNIVVLKNLHMNDLNKLLLVEDKAFSNVIGRSDGENECFSLYLSHCKALSEIQQGAFDGTSLCMLDISSNNLTSLPRELVDWSKLPVNLQSNPWRCSCELQWMLDELLPHLYKYNSMLLNDLRCGSPRALDGLRLVHWYNWTEQPMCTHLYMRSGPRDTYLISPSTEQDPFLSRVSSMTLILGGCIIVSLLIAIALSVYLIKTRKKYKIRQSALQRKRQSAADTKDTNGFQKEQFTALNKT